MPSEISVKVVADSISPDGERLTSIETEYSAHIHVKLLETDELSISSVPGGTGRIRSLMTATAWEDVCAELDAEGGLLAVLARTIQRDRFHSVPVTRVPNSWHLPYVDRDTIENACVYALEDLPNLGLSVGELDATATAFCQKISVARCARVGEGWMAVEGEIATYDHLIAQCAGRPMPAAFQHPAQVDQIITRGTDLLWAGALYHGNFVGWKQYGLGLIRETVSHIHDESKVVRLFDYHPIKHLREQGDTYGQSHHHA